MSDPVGPSEAARRLGVSTRTVQRWLREGRLPAVRVGSRLKVAGAALPLGPAGGHQDSAASQLGSVMAGPRVIRRLLVANRGELVVRIARTCHSLGVRCLALVAQDQAHAWWTSAGDEMVPLNGSYLDVGAVLDAARAAGADAIHPGYGFLAENADFAEDVLRAGLAWLGPPPSAMRALGDKASARRLAQAAGVPVVPGYDGEAQRDDQLAEEARRIGFPLLVKPSAGGGGKGMHVVSNPDGLAHTLEQARREARAAFADDRLVLEHYLAPARHIEIQLLADGAGNVVHLGERECSLQRRHQKVVEEAPAPGVDEALRARLGEAAVELAKRAGYEGAGTAEFLLAADGSFYFLELNARLQVEHPVTELVTGRDLVADQLRIAAGEPLGFSQQDVVLRGHAIEARLYAEDPWAGFLPAAGEIADIEWPTTEGLRIDTGVGPGDVVGTRYDPLLAKLIGWGAERGEALARLQAALEQTSVLGVTTNRGFLGWLLGLLEVQRGRSHTQLIEQRWRPAEELPTTAIAGAAAALAEQLASGRRAHSLVAPGFRLNASPALRLAIDGETRLQALAGDAGPPPRWRKSDDQSIVVDAGGRSLTVRLAPPPSVADSLRQGTHEGGTTQQLSATMPGVVLDVRVAEGDEVEAGQVLLVLEAMKMENAVRAAAPARVTRVLVEDGQQVQRGDVLVELA